MLQKLEAFLNDDPGGVTVVIPAVGRSYEAPCSDYT
jgi:hypothetical protein